MRALVLSSLAVLGVAVAADVRAWEWEPAVPVEAGSWVSVQVEVDGRAMPLYSSEDGTRRYVEARAGGRYELKLANRTGQRLGVKVAVDGLNVISGERDHAGPDRMYVLGRFDAAGNVQASKATPSAGSPWMTASHARAAVMKSVIEFTEAIV